MHDWRLHAVARESTTCYATRYGRPWSIFYRLKPLLLLCLLLVGGCASRIALRAEIDIAAPREIVWAVLTDLSRYPEWNPFTTRIDGTLGEGADLVLHVALRPGHKEKRQRQRVVALVAPDRIAWRTYVGTPTLLRAQREQLLTSNAAGTTHYSTTDSFSGGLVPLVMSLYRKDMERGFATMTQALKARAEVLAAQPPSR